MIDAADAIRRIVLEAARLSRLDALARPLLGGVGAILMLHRVTDAQPARQHGPNRHLSIAPAFLDATVAAMKADGFVFVAMDEVLERLRAGSTGQRFATVTADDGYRDNLREALPVLERHGAPITLYLAPALIDGAVPLWWDAIEEIAYAGKPVALPGTAERLAAGSGAETFRRLLRHLTEEVEETQQSAVLRRLADQAGTDPFRSARDLMTWDEVRTFARHPLAAVGAHSVHHFALRRLGEEAAMREIRGSRERLSAELGEPPRHFAYPYGYPAAAGPREARLVREAGFASAVTTRHGLVQEGHAGHLHALPRISLNGRFQSVGQARVMTRGFTAPLSNGGRRLVTV